MTDPNEKPKKRLKSIYLTEELIDWLESKPGSFNAKVTEILEAARKRSLPRKKS